MLSNASKIYPKCFFSLRLWLREYPERMEIYNKITPQLFDVSLRDGLQTLSKEMQYDWTTQQKINTFYTIKFNHNPTNIEIGSLVNPKILPIFNDSIELYNSIEKDNQQIENIKTDNKNSNNKPYLLIPNIRMLHKAIENNIKNYSFITSVSNSFQKKNTNMTLDENKNELQEMLKIIINEKSNIKLYISCINECPLNGHIDNDYIIHEILHYGKNEKIKELCLSDTCGTLKFEDFEYIIDTCLYFGLPSDKISLHLHYTENNFDNTKQIVQYALNKKINKFDVSILDEGGCSVTMTTNKCKKNLTYEIFYKILVDYIDKKIKK